MDTIPNESVYNIFQHLWRIDARAFGLCCKRIYSIYSEYRELVLNNINEATECIDISDNTIKPARMYCEAIRDNNIALKHGVYIYFNSNHSIFTTNVLYYYMNKQINKCYYKSARTIYNNMKITYYTDIKL